MQMLKAKLYLLEQQKQAEKLSGIRGRSERYRPGQPDPFLCHAAVYDGEGSPDQCGSQQCGRGHGFGKIDPFINAYLKMDQSDAGGVKMAEKSKDYFVIRRKAVPEVLLKGRGSETASDSERVLSVQEAVDRVGISRSSYYKYQNDIFPFHDEAKGKTVTFVLQMEDERELLSVVLNIVWRNSEPIF